MSRSQALGKARWVSEKEAAEVWVVDTGHGFVLCPSDSAFAATVECPEIVAAFSNGHSVTPSICRERG